MSGFRWALITLLLNLDASGREHAGRLRRIRNSLLGSDPAEVGYEDLVQMIFFSVSVSQLGE